MSLWTVTVGLITSAPVTATIAKYWLVLYLYATHLFHCSQIRLHVVKMFMCNYAAFQKKPHNFHFWPFASSNIFQYCSQLISTCERGDRSPETPSGFCRWCFCSGCCRSLCGWDSICKEAFLRHSPTNVCKCLIKIYLNAFGAAWLLVPADGMKFLLLCWRTPFSLRSRAITLWIRPVARRRSAIYHSSLTKCSALTFVIGPTRSGSDKRLPSARLDLRWLHSDGTLIKFERRKFLPLKHTCRHKGSRMHTQIDVMRAWNRRRSAAQGIPIPVM